MAGATSFSTFTRNLAWILLAGAWEHAAPLGRGGRVLADGGLKLALGPLVERLLRRFPPGHPPSISTLAGVLREDPGLRAAWDKLAGRPVDLALVWDEPAMEPPSIPGVFVAGPDRPGIPSLTCSGDLAAWLGVTPGELEWLADWQCRRRRAEAEPLHHYRYRWHPRRNRPPRLIEIPKPRLRRIQRRIHDEILALVPLHSAACGFRAGRSVLDHARPHCGREMVARFDLEAFFHSIGAIRVLGLFRTLGYPYSVARDLAGLCTHATRWDRVPRPDLGSGPGWPSWRERNRLASPHLPQGAPSSPSIANLCAYRLDCRLRGLADRLGLRYTRYADDLALSGDRGLARGFDRLHALVGAICLEEGFALNTRKTRLTGRGARQVLCGVVVNAHPNVARDDYDRLKAILWNCVRFGPDGQNREGHADFRAHLSGRVAQVSAINPSRGARLAALLQQIDWGETGS